MKSVERWRILSLLLRAAMMTADDFREIALSLDAVVESSHMNHPDFRANGRIFATLHTNDTYGMVKLTPAEQRELMRKHPKMFEPSAGAWGRQGCTNVRLAAASGAIVRGAVTLAWEAIMALPRPGVRSRSSDRRGRPTRKSRSDPKKGAR